MKLLLSYLAKYQRPFLLACFNSTVNKVLDLMPPVLVGWLVDSLSGQVPALFAGAGFADTRSAVMAVIVLTVVIFLLESLFEWFYKLGFMRVAQQIQHRVRVDLYDKMQRLPQSFYERNRMGNVLAIANDDVNQLERFLNTSFNELLQIAVLFVFASVALTNMSWELALIGMAPVPGILAGSILYQRLVAPRYQRMRRTNGELNSRLENNLSGMQVIKLFNAETFERGRVAEVSHRYRNDNFRIIDLSAAYTPLIRTFITAGFAIGLLVAANWVMQGNGKVSLGGVALYAMLIQRLLWPVTNLGRILDDYERARASLLRITSIFELADEPAGHEAMPEGTGFREIVFDGVGFGYQPESPVLHDINLRVSRGQSVGIVGPTGAGKTTVIKLLSRLHDPDSGTIRIDDRSLSGIDIHDWRRQISVVSQDVYLFHGSIRENIAYGREDVSGADIERAARMARFHDFAAGLPDGYDAIIGERGIKLSGGQRQRLSLARAILKDAPLLILDEATSAVDTQTERAIQENLRELGRDKTLVIIAHRLSTVRHADAIYVLDEGRIADSGTHAELIGRSGLYRELWQVQTGELPGSGGNQNV